MRQRVGFARAIVTEPDALLMDEPFSALDVLTAENLRNELVKLWEGRGAPVKSILIVTHNIEEAVLLADRVLVLSSNPGRIKAELSVELPRPRDRHAPRFEALVDTIYGILTGREESAAAVFEAAKADAAPVRHVRGARARRPVATPTNTPLPDVSPGGLAGLLEILDRPRRQGRPRRDRRRPQLRDRRPAAADRRRGAAAHGPHRRVGHRAHRRGQGVRGRRHPHQQAAVRRARGQARAPLVRAVVQALAATEDHTLRAGFFLDVLRRGFSADEARSQLDTAIDWGRYAELYDYDSDDDELTLEPGATDYL